MRRPTLILAALLGCLAAPGSAPGAEAVRPVPETAYPDARQPQVAVDPAGKVYLVFGTGQAIFCAVPEDSGATYHEPVKVGEVASWALGNRRGPRVAATDKAVVVTTGGNLREGDRGANLLAWRSQDGGRTWRGPVEVNTVPGAAPEQLHHLAAAPDGSLYAVWLDLREKRQQVFGSLLTDGGASWHDEKLIYQSPDGSVCECCQPQVAYDRRGGLHVMWRNNLSGARDMYLVNSDDNGQTFDRPTKLGRGTWPLDHCPMDGGGLAGDDDGHLVTVWRRAQDLFRCTPGKPEFLLGKGEQGWAAAGPRGFYLVWGEGHPGPVEALLPGSDRPTRLTDRGHDPVVAAPVRGKGPVVAAWEDGGQKAAHIRAVVLSPAE
jgi:hypothetical protein